MQIGYARCSTDQQDLRAQKDALARLGVQHDRIYTDRGLSGTSRARPGLDQALAALRDGDTLVVTKLDRLARSVPDALSILDRLADGNARFALGASVYDWGDPFAKMFLQILAVIAEFEANLIRQRTREGMVTAKARGRLKGKAPKLSDRQQDELLKQWGSGNYPVSELAELYAISRPAVYRVLDRHGARVPA